MEVDVIRLARKTGSMDFYSKNTKWKVKMVVILLLINFLGYYGSIAFFSHVHVVDGVTIVHSHPYKPVNKNNLPDNPHSNKELKVIQFLSDFFTTGAIVVFSALVHRLLLTLLPTLATEGDFIRFTGNFTHSLRAPPSF